MQVTVPVLAKIGKTARFPSTTRPTPQCRIRSMAVTQVPVDTLCDFSSTTGTFYFQVRHANKNKGFALEIFGCRSAICSSPFP
ncbi:hypothetical protein, partial [Sinorhizobium meliloti]|uniref:hypothetical protein n=1 Tax=Rhizobium meliloti TaxID=382 RepID=UPI001AECE528